MPNWVATVIRFDGEQANKNNVFKEISGASDEGESFFDFNKLIPMPNGVDWYEWRCENWGTKWNACECTRDGSIITFQTAWSWPNPIMHKLAEICKKYNVCFEGKWADEDCGSNTGYFFTDYDSGELIYDYYDNNSSEAYAAYVACHGKSECIGIDTNGQYYQYDCDKRCPNYSSCYTDRETETHSLPLSGLDYYLTGTRLEHVDVKTGFEPEITYEDLFEEQGASPELDTFIESFKIK